MEEVKLLNLNISCSTPWDEKADLLREIVENEAPDILCLQEVARSIHTDTERHTQINKIAEMFGSNAFYAALTHPYFPGGDLSYQDCFHGPGIVILNKDIAVKDFEKVQIYRGDDGNLGEDRRYFNVAAKLEVAGHELVVVSVHLSSANRMIEAKETLAWIDTNAKDKPIIVTGDLNSFDALNRGKNDVDNIFRARLNDAWKILHPDEIGQTYFGTEWWQLNYPNSMTAMKLSSKGVDFPDGKLDYVYYDGVVPIDIELSRKGIPNLTDHAALSFEFRLD